MPLRTYALKGGHLSGKASRLTQTQYHWLRRIWGHGQFGNLFYLGYSQSSFLSQGSKVKFTWIFLHVSKTTLYRTIPVGFEHVHFSHILKAGFKSFQTLYQKWLQPFPTKMLSWTPDVIRWPKCLCTVLGPKGHPSQAPAFNLIRDNQAWRQVKGAGHGNWTLLKGGREGRKWEGKIQRQTICFPTCLDPAPEDFPQPSKRYSVSQSNRAANKIP